MQDEAENIKILFAIQIPMDFKRYSPFQIASPMAQLLAGTRESIPVP
jgi:hypothetical protein